MGLAVGAGIALPLLAETPVGGLEGRLIARDSGRPLAADVRLSGATYFETKSDARGRFSLRRIPCGAYRFEASSRGHLTHPFVVEVREGKIARLRVEMRRQPSHLQLVVHHHVLYPGEPISIAVRGLTLRRWYRLETYRVSRWTRVQEYEARQYPKALVAAAAAGDVTLVSDRDMIPHRLDPEGLFYDRLNLEPLPPGRYLLVATGETGSRSVEEFTISRLALLVKSVGSTAVVYVTDLKRGTPIAGASVTGPGAAGVTDADGLARLTLRAGGGYGYWSYSARVGADTVSLQTWAGSESPVRYRLFCFTDRPIYRPGDRVQFKGVLRRREGTLYSLPGRKQVGLKVTDEDGTEIYKHQYETSDQGSFTGAYTLPQHALAGTYTMTSTVDEFSDETFVTVASYLKPELQLSARPMKTNYIRGQTATVEIQAAYYFGAPAADLSLQWMLTRAPYYPSADGEYGDYAYADDGYDEYGGGELVKEGEAKTDDAGRIRLKLPTRLPVSEQEREQQDPYVDDVFSLQVWSTSEAGGAAEASTRYYATRGSFYLTAALDGYVLTPGKATGVRVQAHDFNDHPVANRPVRLSLVREIQPRGRGKVQRRVLASWDVATDMEGIAKTTVTPPREGEFVLEALARDAQGRAIALREYLWAWSAGEEYWDFGRGQTEISIVADRKQYHERDRVKLLVTCQRAGAGILCLEGDRLYDVRPLSLRKGANLVELDLKPEYVPNCFVWIGQVYDKRLHQAQKEIGISRDTRRLRVTVKPDRADYRPEDTAACDVLVTDAAGRPAQAEIALGVVDEAIYALASDNVEDPADYFYEHRYNRVSTDFAPSGYYLGGADKAPSTIEVRRRFMDTAFWAPQVMTDSGGRARVSFKLPDNLTSWRATVRAVSADTHGGTGRGNFRVNKLLMVRLDIPRFATQGDRFRVSAYVHNETDNQREVVVSSWTRGLKLEGGRERLTVSAHHAERRDWWATATGVGKAVIGASATTVGAQHAAPLSDAVELPLPLNPLARTQFDAWSGRTEDAVSLSVPMRDDAFAARTRLTVAVSPSIAASLLSSLDYLADYPYGCVEQTVSSFLPNLYVLQLLEARGMGDSALAKGIPPMLAAGLVLLSDLQREEGGGWGWGRWGDLDIWMTAYALMALDEARRVGYSTMDIGPPLSQLESALRGKRREYPDDLAFAAYILSRLKSQLAIPTTMQALSNSKLSGRGRALCALAFFEQGNPTAAHRVMQDLWRTAKQEGRWTYWTGLQDQDSRWWDGGANVEATAWALKATLRADAKDPRAAAIAGWLLQNRQGERWVSTRDTAIALYALVDYLRTVQEPNPDYTAVVKVNGRPLLSRGFAGEPKTWQEVEVEVPAGALRRGVNTVTFARVGPAGRLYYRANLRQQVAMKADEETASGAIFRVRREYFKLGRAKSAGGLAYGPALRPGDAFANGERVLVRLTLTSSQRLRYVLIEDPFPAGLEPSARGDVGFMDWRSWWVDNDVRDDRVTFYLDWLPMGKQVIEYVMTARTPGRFHAVPATGFAMYQPSVNAVGEQALMEVSR
jgi:uncharacterized protein YfaS (alpha-2-macroglobulin family)